MRMKWDKSHSWMFDNFSRGIYAWVFTIILFKDVAKQVYMFIKGDHLCLANFAEIVTLDHHNHVASGLCFLRTFSISVHDVIVPVNENKWDMFLDVIVLVNEKKWDTCMFLRTFSSSVYDVIVPVNVFTTEWRHTNNHSYGRCGPNTKYNADLTSEVSSDGILIWRLGHYHKESVVSGLITALLCQLSHCSLLIFGCWTKYFVRTSYQVKFTQCDMTLDDIDQVVSYEKKFHCILYQAILINIYNVYKYNLFP